MKPIRNPQKSLGVAAPWMRAAWVLVAAIVHPGFDFSAAALPDADLRSNPALRDLYDRVTDLDAAKRATLDAVAQHGNAILAYDPANPATIEPARKALVALYGVQGETSNLANVHWALKVKAIDEVLSAKGAQIRNDMVHAIFEQITADSIEIHRMDFSPAKNMLNDIDQTLKAGDLQTKAGVSGIDLVKSFNETFEDVFGIPPQHLDVVSHPYEQRPPDWRLRTEVHQFLADFRKGSALLQSNPEAYFLEGAYRLQVDRRSFENDEPLYTIYRATTADDKKGIARLEITTKKGTIKELRYQFRRPETRRGYAWGSAVGNWHFMKAHGYDTRSIAKYGLRSFAESVGWMALFDEAATNNPDRIPYFSSYEDMVDETAKRAVVQKAYSTYYSDFDLSFDEVLWTVERARHIRQLKDKYNQEAAFADAALELAGNDAAAYETNREALLEEVETRFRENMVRLTYRNIETALPARLADWIQPTVDPLYLGFKPEELGDDPDNPPEKVRQAVEAARERLSWAAMHELVTGLHVLDPHQRQLVLERARNDLKLHADTTGKGHDLLSMLDALAFLSENEAPSAGRGHQEDTDERPRTNVGTDENPVRLASDDPVAKIEAYEQTRLDELRAIGRELEAVMTEKLAAWSDTGGTDVRAILLADVRDALPMLGQDALRRWYQACEDVNKKIGTLGENLATVGRAAATRDVRQLLLPHEIESARRYLNREAWQALGAELKKGGDELRLEDWRFRSDKMVGTAMRSAITWQNADFAIKLAQAYRSSNGNWEAVRETAGSELVGRLPVVGEINDLSDLLAGRTHPGMLGVKAASFFYPGVGQVVLAVNVVNGAWELFCDIQLEAATAIYLQGTIPNADRSTGDDPQGRPGLLRPVFDAMFAKRRSYESTIERLDADDPRRADLEERLKLYPPTMDGAKNFVFEFFDPMLEQAFDRGGIPEGRRTSMKLSSHMGTIRSVEPEELRNPANLPPNLRAFFRPIVLDYLRGTGQFAGIAGHRVAHAHPLLRDRYFFSDADNRVQFDQTEESLVSVLVVAYIDSLVKSLEGEAPGPLRVQRGWDNYTPVAVSAYLEGLGGGRIATLDPLLDPASVPDLPSILDAVPASIEFFQYFDDELNRRYRSRYPNASLERLAELKLGTRYADLRAVAAENAAVAHPLLNAFFNRWLAEWYAQQPPVSLDVPNVDVPFGDGALGNYQERDPEALRQRLQEIENGTFEKLRPRLVQALVAYYKQGLLRELEFRRREQERQMIARQLPGAFAAGRLVDTFFGSSDTAAPPYDADAFGLLLASSGDPHLFDEAPPGAKILAMDNPAELFQSLLASGDNDQVSIKLSGVPNSPIKPGDKLSVDCRVSAPDRFRAPYEVSWSMRRLGGTLAAPQPADRSNDSSMQIVSLPVSGQDGRPAPGKYEIVADVYDGSPDRKLIGNATAPFEIAADPEIEVSVEAHPVWSYHDPYFTVFVKVDGWDTLPIDPEAFAPLQFANTRSPEFTQRWGDVSYPPNYRQPLFAMLRFDYAGASTSFLCAYPAEGFDYYHSISIGSMPRTGKQPWVYLRPRMLGRMPVRLSIFPGPDIDPIVHDFVIDVSVPPASQNDRESMQKSLQNMNDRRAEWAANPENERYRNYYYSAWNRFYEDRMKVQNRAIMWLQSASMLNQEIDNHLRGLPGDAELLRKYMRVPLADRAIAQLVLGNPYAGNRAIVAMENLYVRALPAKEQDTHVKFTIGLHTYPALLETLLWQRFDVDAATGVRARIQTFAPGLLEKDRGHTAAQWQYDVEMVKRVRQVFPAQAFP